MRSKSIIFILIIIFISTINPISARSRLDSIENFLDEMRISQSGFVNTLDDGITVANNNIALNIARSLGFEVNNSLDILYFMQQAHHENGGFSSDLKTEPNWKATYAAINALKKIDLNGSQLSDWGIGNYLNESAQTILYHEKIVNNETIILPNNLTISTIVLWQEFIIGTFLINYEINIPRDFLVDNLRDLQFDNGSYSSLDLAINSVKLLSMLNEAPNDLELSSKFIRVFQTDSGLFSNTLDGPDSIKTTREAMEALVSLNELINLEYQNEIVLHVLNLQKPNSGFSSIDNLEPSLEGTWDAISILAILGALDELESPDVLQDHGFISFNITFTLLGLTTLFLIHRRKKS